MSNKTLITIVVILVVIFGLGIGWYAWRNNSSHATGVDSNNASAQNSPTQSIPVPSSGATPTPNLGSTTTALNPTPTTTMNCNKDFDPNKLQTNANIPIANRQVTIAVAGYGDIVLGFSDADAPNTVKNFLRLVDAGYYDCVTFHRVAQGFVIQGGDPTGTGAGGQTASGQPLQDELNANTPSYKTGYMTGVLAMAETSQPNTGTSQFFIMLGDHPELPHAYPIFGKVISGMDVVEKIGQVQTNPVGDGAPVTPVVMQKVSITK